MRKWNKLLALLLAMVMALGMTATAMAEGEMDVTAAPTGEDGDIVIVHTNDIHCEYEAYDKVAAVAKDADLLLDAGDAIQGDVIGTLSKGSYVVDIMNELGYDAAIPGNHEFDYGMDTFLNIVENEAEYPYLSANFVNLDGSAVLDAYKIFEVQGKKVAVVGITTPETFTKSTPTYFQNAEGEYIYGFCEGNDGADLYAAVQKAVDDATAAGADYIVALAHLGIDEASQPWTSSEVIANTTGIDVMIDGHSHSTFTETVKNKAGEDVVVAQTGTKLANVGKVTIKADGTITAETIALENVEADPEATAFIATITEKFDALQNTVVAKTEVELTIKGADGKRAVRKAETNLGDLCADAYRTLLGADVAFVNGGGVRDNIAIGDITYGAIIKVHPFGNAACLVEVTGQQIKDALEMGSRAVPGENGGFLQVSGLTYTINTDIPSSVKLDDKGMFVSVDGEYRVCDIMVDGKPLDVNKTYTLASHNYMLKSQGDGYAMFGKDKVKILQDEVLIDNQVLINYIVDELGGVVGQEYAQPQGRIKVIGTATRAELVEALYALAGSPEVTGTNPFTDVADDAAYKNAVIWAYETGVVKGTSATTFDPETPVKRQEIAAILYRYAVANGDDVSVGEDTNILSYADAETISEYAVPAMQWACGTGLLQGDTSGKLNPMSSATDEEAEIILGRYAA